MHNKKKRHKKLLSKAKNLCIELVVKVHNTVLVMDGLRKQATLCKNHHRFPPPPKKKMPEEQAEKFFTGDE